MCADYANPRKRSCYKWRNKEIWQPGLMYNHTFHPGKEKEAGGENPHNMQELSIF